MLSQRERILDYLRGHPQGADDDLLAAELSIPHRQAVNEICRQLERRGVLVRQHDPVAGKIVNRLAEGCGEQTEATGRSHPTPPIATRVPATLLTLDEEGVRRFAYPGELQLAEDSVKQAVEAVLNAGGWTVATRWGRAHGIDIDARRGKRRLVLEAKGEGSRPEMRVNFFLGALGELLQRMTAPDVRYGLALPAHRQFVSLVLRLPAWVRARLDLCFFLVRPAADGGLEVGLFAHEGRDL